MRNQQLRPRSNKIDWDSPAEAVFQNFRKWALKQGKKFDSMPLYDFGTILSRDHLGQDIWDSAALRQQGLMREHGLHLPYQNCAFINRVPTVKYSGESNFSLWIASRRGDETKIKYFLWTIKDGWIACGTYRRGGRYERAGDQGNEVFHFHIKTPHISQHERDELIRDTGMMLLIETLVALNLVMDRGDGVERNSRPPSSTPGRTTVHPLAPSSVITIRIDRERLSRPQPAGRKGKPKRPHNRAGAIVHYKSGKTGIRKESKIHGGSDPKTYKVTD
jgi:hypothetical protein